MDSLTAFITCHRYSLGLLSPQPRTIYGQTERLFRVEIESHTSLSGSRRCSGAVINDSLMRNRGQLYNLSQTPQ
jgi:hypothetical protein